MSFIATFSKHSRGLVWLLLAAGLAGCGGGGDSPSAEVPQGFVSVNIPWQTRAAVPAKVEKIRLSIEAADMAPVAAVLTQADVVDGVAKKTVSVPAGENRLIRGTAFDGKDQPVGRGISAAFNVSAGKTTSVSLTLAEVKAGAAIETRTGVSLLNQLGVLETTLKEQVDLTSIQKDTQKVWFEFKLTHHLAYIYGSGRVIVIGDRNLQSLDDFDLLDAELARVLNIIDLRSDDVDLWKLAYARTWLSAVYTHQVGIYRRINIPGMGGWQWLSIEGMLRIPDPAPINARQVAQNLENAWGWWGCDGWCIDGEKLNDFRVTSEAWSRIYTSRSLSKGDHTMKIKAYDAYDRVYFYVEAFFAQSPAADQEFFFIKQGGEVASTLVSKHLDELVLGP